QIPGQELQQWQRVKTAATEVLVQQGAALSHHHGVGTMHRPWMQAYLGPQAANMLHALKRSLDPRAIMNPAKLLPEEKLATAVPAAYGSFSHKTRAANLERMANESFDLVVIGGGITGAGIARDAALRGLKVALLEKGDFASGTSSKSSKMIHGGLRYLKQLDLKLVKESLHEREILLHLAPHLIHATPYLIPSYKGRLEKIEYHIGMIGYDLLASSKSIAHYQTLSPEQVTEQEPNLKKQGLRGGFIYYDCLVNDARLTLATIKSAAEQGAVVANYVECVGMMMEDHRIRGVQFRDVLGDRRGTLNAQVVVNATGPWTDRILGLAGAGDPLLRPTKGIHIVVLREKLPVRHIVVLSTHDERMIFVVPLGEFTYIGTTDTDYDGPLDEVFAERAEVQYLLENVNACFENLALDAADVISTWAGLRPLVKEEGSPSSISRDYEIVFDDKGLVTIAGGKLTTYRSMAKTLLDETLQRFADRFSKPASACRTDTVPLYGGEIADFAKYVDGETRGWGPLWELPKAALQRLIQNYGTDYHKVLALALENRAWLQPLVPGCRVLKGEVLYAVAQEMAMTVEDFMARRTDLQHFDTSRGLAAVDEVAELMAQLLGWTDAEKNRQLEIYRRKVAKMMAFQSEPEAESGENPGKQPTFPAKTKAC
ncbi:MAG: glycerol-3-phosphate dehydrogenase, partial [Calditrichaeota bacterium]